MRDTISDQSDPLNHLTEGTMVLTELLPNITSEQSQRVAFKSIGTKLQQAPVRFPL